MILCNAVHLCNITNKEGSGWKMSCLCPQEFVVNTGFLSWSVEVNFQAEIWGCSPLNVGFP